jgi:hypothetical protein
LRNGHSRYPLDLLFAIWPQGVLWGHYGVMLAELSCLRPSTHWLCPMKAYKELGTPL